MRVRVSETDFEVRVQERRVVVADIFFRGKLIASGQATQAPQDEWDLKEGESIALARMVNKLRDVQREEMEYVKRTHPLGRALTFTLTNGTDLYSAAMAKLDRKREKKAKEDLDRQAILNQMLMHMHNKNRQLGTGYFHRLFGGVSGPPFQDFLGSTGRLSSSSPNIQTPKAPATAAPPPPIQTTRFPVFPRLGVGRVQSPSVQVPPGPPQIGSQAGLDALREASRNAFLRRYFRQSPPSR